MPKISLSELIDRNSISIPSLNESSEDYVRASSIGSDCLRFIWYEYKRAVVDSKAIPERVKRTWQIGHKLESLVLQWLENAGIDINCTQHDLKDSELDYFKGHIDGVWTVSGKKTPVAIIEVKTAKDASFKLFVKNGLKKWNTNYYSQLQAYMGMSGIYDAYLIALNKDTSDLHDELVLFDQYYYEHLKDKARMVYESIEAPARVNNSPLWFSCKTCKYRGICHK